MYLFDSCEDEYHICGVDNLFMSAKFCKDMINNNKNITYTELPESLAVNYLNLFYKKRSQTRNIKIRSEAPFALQN